jgi:hypothetical protein
MLFLKVVASNAKSFAVLIFLQSEQHTCCFRAVEPGRRLWKWVGDPVRLKWMVGIKYGMRSRAVECESGEKIEYEGVKNVR